jgi:Rrf2 family transcriptional regulator, iron-sulfur cluster assembly transcription factor
MFSKATEYALRATIFIARHATEENKVSITAIAKAIDAPQSFTAKILQSLGRHHSLVRSTTGPNGGFYMTDNAKQLPARAILQAMGEDEMLGKCVLGLAKCSEVKPCPMHAEYKLIKAQLISLFENKTIRRLADDIESGDVYISNKRIRPKK